MELDAGLVTEIDITGVARGRFVVREQVCPGADQQLLVLPRQLVAAFFGYAREGV